jgi:hypothetical protein
MKMGMHQRGVDNEFANCTEGPCLFVVTACALGFVAQLTGGGVNTAATTGFDVAAFALGFVAQLMGGGVDVSATTFVAACAHVMGNEAQYIKNFQ